MRAPNFVLVFETDLEDVIDQAAIFLNDDNEGELADAFRQAKEYLGGTVNLIMKAELYYALPQDGGSVHETPYTG